ncbi:MAG: winged helix-turn-helix domain-containing protein, partial [Myxococcota bacterium]
MLRYLAASTPRAVSNDELLNAVWGYAANVRSRAVRVAVRRLRAKLEADPAAPVHLVTVRGQGYRLDAEPMRDPDLHPPTPLGPLIGRDEALSQVLQRLQTQRLLTLEGSPGVGKTRLALEVGRRWPGPVGWFPLAGATDAESALGRIATRISARVQSPA